MGPPDGVTVEMGVVRLWGFASRPACCAGPCSGCQSQLVLRFNSVAGERSKQKFLQSQGPYSTCGASEGNRTVLGRRVTDQGSVWSGGDGQI